MNAILILVLISILVATVFLILFAKAIFNGQFDEIETPKVMLFDEYDEPNK